FARTPAAPWRAGPRSGPDRAESDSRAAGRGVHPKSCRQPSTADRFSFVWEKNKEWPLRSTELWTKPKERMQAPRSPGVAPPGDDAPAKHRAVLPVRSRAGAVGGVGLAAVRQDAEVAMGLHRQQHELAA